MILNTLLLSITLFCYHVFMSHHADVLFTHDKKRQDEIFDEETDKKID